MTPRIVWTDQRDTLLLALRASGLSWDRIAANLGISRWSAIERGNAIGAWKPPPAPPRRRALDLGREPLPTGHPVTWGAITAGTPFADTDYPFPPLPVEQ